ncbi:MAG: MBL fold metallo-hydrolase [Candidatus Hydrogenedentota bacterium]
MIFHQIQLGPMENWVYIIGCQEVKDGAVIDPGWESNRILEIIYDNKLKLKYILNTHSHFDHTAENRIIKNATGALIAIGENEPEISPPPDILLKDNQVILLGSLKIKTIYTPGHTSGGVCYYVDNKLFTGDTIFAGGEVGRTDLPGGSDEKLITSIRKISKLPDDTLIYSGHNYSGVSYTTLKDEKNINSYFMEGSFY